jgi:hypothetical protein
MVFQRLAFEWSMFAHFGAHLPLRHEDIPKYHWKEPMHGNFDAVNHYSFITSF